MKKKKTLKELTNLLLLYSLEASQQACQVWAWGLWVQRQCQPSWLGKYKKTADALWCVAPENVCM